MTVKKAARKPKTAFGPGSVVEVSEGDVADGLKLDCGACPVALAVRRMAPGKKVAITPGYIHVDGERFAMPGDATRFVLLFDHGVAVGPLRFKVGWKVPR